MANSCSRPSDEYHFRELRERIELLLDKQELRLASTMNNMSLGDAGLLPIR